MDPIAFILLAALSGVFVGGLARLAIPGPDPMSIFQTMLVGVAGSLIAALITHYAFDREGAPGILLSVICAAVLVFAIRKIRERGAGDRPVPSSAYPGLSTTRVSFMPGCLVFSLLASVGLTILLNLLIRAL